MKQLLISLLCVLGSIAVAIPASAQQNGGGKITVSGQVIDGDGLPVVGAVVMTASNEATVTDADGNWNLAVKDPQATLQFSCLGYKNLSEPINGRNVINVTLQTDNVMLEETVVVGYGVQKKVNLTGSVAAIDFSDLAITLKQAVIENGQEIAPAVTLRYGAFIQVVIDFIIIAFAIFLMIKAMAMLQKKKDESEAAAPAPEPQISEEEKLLTEIRDILKEKK